MTFVSVPLLILPGMLLSVSCRNRNGGIWFARISPLQHYSGFLRLPDGWQSLICGGTLSALPLADTSSAGVFMPSGVPAGVCLA